MNLSLSKAFWLLAMACFLPLSSSAAEIQPVMGGGPSTQAAKLFFEHFSKLPVAQGYEFSVDERSIKHAGGIEASGKYLFGRTGRPLNAEERALNKKDIFLVRAPVAFTVGNKVGINKLSKQQFSDIFTGKITHWKSVGGPDAKIILVGREPTEAAFLLLKEDYPFLAQTRFDTILTRDHQVVNFIKSDAGDYAISFGFKANFEGMNVLNVEGLRTTSNCGLVYDVKNEHHPLVKAAIEYANSPEWRKILTAHQLLAPNP